MFAQQRMGPTNRIIVSDGPFAYNICCLCRPYYEVAAPIAVELWMAQPQQNSCISCSVDSYEGRSLYNHPRCLSLGDSMFVCGDCRGPIDQVRDAAIFARRQCVG